MSPNSNWTGSSSRTRISWVRFRSRWIVPISANEAYSIACTLVRSPTRARPSASVRSCDSAALDAFLPSPEPKAVIFGCAGSSISPDERAFFRDADPVGFILFKRNCESPGQVRALVQDLRGAIGRADAPVLIDQEGGRVARLQPPHWRSYPAPATLGTLGGARAREAVRL